MPKQTFLNLSSEKQERFLRTAFKEFAKYDYNSASVSRIVRELGIAKGSIYQYFNDKADLYDFLLESAARKKLDSMTFDISDIDDNAEFFTIIKIIILSGIRFDLRNPTISLFLMNATEEKQQINSRNISLELREKSMEYLREIYIRCPENREPRDDAETDLFIHVLNSGILSLGTYLEHRFSFSARAMIDQSASELPCKQHELEKIVDDFVGIFREKYSG